MSRAALIRQTGINTNSQTNEVRRGRLPDSGDGAGAGEFVTGSLTWQLEQLQRGEFVLKPNAGESMHRSSLRAVSVVTHKHQVRECDLSLWYAVHHSGKGETLRMYKLMRVK
ncbi:hypothetical protein DLM46_29360 [Paraburkholderia lacunae]|uniref:Uncharacterized protein n=1 Tax=Paraburkholderia lacunae TaxID=2211104 RepID=A0A370N1J8_9BURK|nr:hypothetical protein DLM46_29360 [Paraburkholderia lacunae]